MTEIINWFDKIGVNKKKKLPKKWEDNHIHHNCLNYVLGPLKVVNLMR